MNWFVGQATQAPQAHTGTQPQAHKHTAVASSMHSSHECDRLSRESVWQLVRLTTGPHSTLHTRTSGWYDNGMTR
jgi:hypothetical protein